MVTEIINGRDSFDNVSNRKKSLPEIKATKGDILSLYSNIEHIFTGGEGRIAKAQSEDGRDVIVKIYAPEKVDDWDDFNKAKEGAEKEIAFLYKSISRSDLPRILEHGYTGHLNEPVAVMEPIEGETLENIIGNKGFNPKMEDALSLAKNISETLKYAHEEVGVEPFIHRDIKPANIMVDSSGKPVVLDWSTGKVGGGNTVVNTMIFSRYYIAPEVEEGKTVSIATDVYGLAKTLQHYLTGEKFVDLNGKVRKQDFSDKVPLSVVNALEKATSLDPKKRYQTVDDFVKGLEGSEVVVSQLETGSYTILTRQIIGGFVGAAIGLTNGIIFNNINSFEPLEYGLNISSPGWGMCMWMYFGHKFDQVKSYLKQRKQKQLPKREEGKKFKGYPPPLDYF